MIVAGYYGFKLDASVCPSVSRTFVRPSVFRLRMITWVNINGFFTKFSMCINIVEIWFGIANGQISSNFDGIICPRHTHIFVSGR